MAKSLDSTSMRLWLMLLTLLSQPITTTSSSVSTSHNPDYTMAPLTTTTTPDPNTKTTFPYTDNLRPNISTIIDHSSDRDLYILLIQVMKKLDILPSNSACIKLEKISTDVITVNKRTHSQTVGVHLYFHTRKKEDFRSAESRDCSSVPVVNVDGHSLTRDKLALKDSTSGAGYETVTTAMVNSGSDMTSQANNGSAGVLVGTKTVAVHNNRQTDDDRGISRTQLVVISTCSAIIGTFFIVAGILRLRYYYKRYEEERILAQRPTFRSCSIALRNPTASTEQIRRDSMLSKSSSYQSNCTQHKWSNQSQNGVFSRDQSGNDSPKMSADKMPLLVVTSASDPSTPVSSVSQQSFQFIDEEPSRRKNSPFAASQDDIEAEPLLTQEFDGREITPVSRPPVGREQECDRLEDIGKCNILFDHDQLNNMYDKTTNDRNCAEVLISPDVGTHIDSCPLDSYPQFSGGSNSGEILTQAELSSLSPHHNGNKDSPTCFGLTQSDSSLCAANPFRHSSQVEYCPPPLTPGLELATISINHSNSPKPLLRSVSLPARSVADQSDHNRFQNTSLRTTGPSYSLVERPITTVPRGVSPVISESSIEESQLENAPVGSQSSFDTTGPSNAPIGSQSSFDATGPSSVPVVRQSSLNAMGLGNMPVVSQSRLNSTGPTNAPVVRQSNLDTSSVEEVEKMDKPPQICEGRASVHNQSSMDSSGPGKVPVTHQSNMDLGKIGVTGQSSTELLGSGKVAVTGQSTMDSSGSGKDAATGQSSIELSGSGKVAVTGQSSLDSSSMNEARKKNKGPLTREASAPAVSRSSCMDEGWETDESPPPPAHNVIPVRQSSTGTTSCMDEGWETDESPPPPAHNVIPVRQSSTGTTSSVATVGADNSGNKMKVKVGLVGKIVRLEIMKQCWELLIKKRLWDRS
ncbi:mucin-12-like isoform X2 [Gigantopelta aegis]|uniref:mucin-12-like isoform X2 n=1 Tax=Gigantopelta aegis TaxID=1735272 RepID=UPI001B888ACE|nr:mucin-12-like isoform X2 [Gigantopelta aegis]